MRVRFFVTGHGRSGTKWLADLLNRCDPGVAVHHEPLGRFDRDRYYWLGCHSFLAERESRMLAFDDGREYAEVNSYLRYCVSELRQWFHVPVAVIIRDGRYVVRSMLARGAYQRPGYPEVEAPDDLTDAFEKCCWYWAETYREIIAPTWRLEDLNAHYDVFGELCEYLGMPPDWKAWDACAGKPLNTGVNNPIIPAWGEAQQETFERLAGEVYARFY